MKERSEGHLGPRTRHTPGTWKWNGHWRVCAFDADGKITVVICDTAHNAKGRTDETNANARLIAAAPDLLAACEKQDKLIRFYGILLANYRVGTRPGEMTLDEVNKAAAVADEARAALNSARGGE